jgi:hypothetical protein
VDGGGTYASDGHLPGLGSALALAAAELAAPPVLALAAVDPLRVELPPVAGAPAPLTRETLRSLGALYLLAELEQTGLVAVAERLAAARLRLDTRSVAAAARLEDFAVRARDWHPADQRAILYARLFGTGPAAAATGASANRDFEPRLAAACAAVVQHEAPLAAGSAFAHAALWHAAAALASSLAARGSGAAVVAGRRLAEQARAAVALLSDPGVAALLGERGAWDVVRRVLGDATPDLRRLIDRGRGGQAVIAWLPEAGVLAPQRPPRIAVSPAALAGAASWLTASGLTLRTGVVGGVR